MEKLWHIRRWGRRFPLISNPIYLDFVAGERQAAMHSLGQSDQKHPGLEVPLLSHHRHPLPNYAEFMERTDWDHYVSGQRPAGAPSAWCTAVMNRPWCGKWTAETDADDQVEPPCLISCRLFWGTVVLRPYVFAFLAIYLAAAATHLGWRRTLLFLPLGYSLAWLSEYSSIHWGFPYGDYFYIPSTAGSGAVGLRRALHGFALLRLPVLLQLCHGAFYPEPGRFAEKQLVHSGNPASQAVPADAGSRSLSLCPAGHHYRSGCPQRRSLVSGADLWISGNRVSISEFR